MITVYDSLQCLVGLVDRQLKAFAVAEIDARGAQPEDPDGFRPVTRQELLLGECRLVAATGLWAGIHEHAMPPI
eukprot:4321663-Lingulodinium_polyedra.AAC.1